MDVLEISSDSEDSSEDTIIVPQDESNKCINDNVDPEIANIVNKYILENNASVSKTTNEVDNKYNFSSDDEDMSEIPKIKANKHENTLTNSILENRDSVLNRQTSSPKSHKPFLDKYLSHLNNQSTVKTVSKKIDTKSKTKLEKELEKQEKNKEREREKALKKALQEANKHLKPEECMKFITVHLDDNLMNEQYGQDISNALQITEATFKVQSQIFPHTVTWTRKVNSHFIDENDKLVMNSETKDTDEILLVTNYDTFVEHVSNNLLTSQIQTIKSVLGERKISLVIFGLLGYFRYHKNLKNSEINSVLSDNTKKYKTLKKFHDLPKVSRREVEYALTELQLLCSCSHRMVETGPDLGQAIAQFTKATAQLPYKLQKQEKCLQTDWFASGDNKDCVKIDKNGNGLQRLWSQIFTTFPLARLETAEAITAQYPTLTALSEAYEHCNTVTEAESLLQDIPIRRAAGPLTSVRRIGPELSKKVYNFFNSLDGDVLL